MNSENSFMFNMASKMQCSNKLILLRNFFGICLLFSIPLSTTLTNIFILLYIFFLVFSNSLKETFHFFKSPIVLSILLLLSINLLSIIYTVAPFNDILISLKKNSRLLLLPLLMPVFRDVFWQNRGFLVFVGAILLSVIYNYVIFFNYNYYAPFFKDRIYTSSLTAFGIFLLCVFISEIKLSKYIKIILTMLTIACIYYLFFVNSGRTGQIIFFPLMIIFAYKNLDKKIIKTFTFIIFMIISILLIDDFDSKKLISSGKYSLALQDEILVSPMYSRFKEAYKQSADYFLRWSTTKGNDTPRGQASSIRLEFYLNTFKLCLKKPFLGYGMGSFTTVYNAHYPERFIEGQSVKNPHNQYLLTYLELGIPGFLALIILFFSIILQVKFLKSEVEKTILWGVFYFMVLGCAINSWLLDFTSCIFFISMMAVITAPSIKKESVSCEFG